MKPVVIESTPELAKAFFAGRCDAVVAGAAGLAEVQAFAVFDRFRIGRTQSWDLDNLSRSR